MGKRLTKARQDGRRYIFHNDRIPGDTRIHLVYYYVDTDIVLMSDGPFFQESDAINKMKEYLLKGRCSWVVVYNE